MWISFICFLCRMMGHITDEVLPDDIMRNITDDIISDISDNIMSLAEQIWNKGYPQEITKAESYFGKQLQDVN